VAVVPDTRRQGWDRIDPASLIRLPRHIAAAGKHEWLTDERPVRKENIGTAIVATLCIAFFIYIRNSRSARIT